MVLRRHRPSVGDFAATPRPAVWRKSERHVTCEKSAVAERRQLRAADAVAAENPRQYEVEHRRFREEPARRQSEHWHRSQPRDPEEAPWVRRHALADPLPAEIIQRDKSRIQL